ncbi:MAG: hypothetical protein L0Y44_10525 [Phycisphaerales bacterium]|nr:hypothetical protein [Phycisphaerales bacterium]MCI0631072.1 hypothetical protein [Phycisphaerales bacterium]MCI0676615.1 hypothetical protein [Phycisphaerales bacterium]
MRDFRLRTDLERVVIDGFALPLGIAPSGTMRAPVQGYTVSYVQGEDDEPDTYSFHVVVSHERLAALVHRAFDLLPDEVFGIVEIGSRDAYRSTDTFIGQESISREQFIDSWRRYEPFLLEDGSIAAGANNEEPFIEVFVDQWKGLSIHVPLDSREEVEQMLRDFGLDEVPQTWSMDDEPKLSENGEESMETSQVRTVLDLSDDYSPDVDEILLNLRHEWNLELNIDPDSNVDDAGRNLGSTLWHAVIIVERAVTAGRRGNDKQAEPGAYASIWATATSMAEMEELIQTALESHPKWAFGEIYTIDRVAFDERPDDLANLRPNRRQAEVHLMTFEPFGSPPSDFEPDEPTSKKGRKSRPGDE